MKPLSTRTLKSERGSILVLVAVLLVGLLAFTALAIDIGWVMVARNELQNAADAAALAGASSLFPATGPPAWSNASSKARTNVGKNKVLGTLLTDASIDVGYYDLKTRGKSLKSPSSTPAGTDAAAVQVVIRKAADPDPANPGKTIAINQGPIALFFAPIVGVNTFTLSATATAAMSYPGSVNGNANVLPMVMSKCFYDQIWDPATGTPTQPGSEYTLEDPYPGGGTCTSGQWSTLLDGGNNSAAVVKGIIDNGNPNPLSIGDPIHIVTGTKASAYIALEGRLSANGGTLDVVLPVVGAVTPNGTYPILGFAAVTITGANHQGKTKYVTFKVRTGVVVSTGGNPGGPNYGALTPPKLVQ